MPISENLSALKTRITAYEEKYGREKNSVTLLAASKGQSVEKILQAFDAGQTRFGENYLQEALAKMLELADKPIEWHFIGAIQSNKTRKIAEHFSWVHSVCDKKIAKRLNDQRPTSLPPLNICIEVNLHHEKTKSGVPISEVKSLTEYCLTLPRLKLQGLMTIPEPKKEFTTQRQVFHELLLLQQSLQQQGVTLNTLSMGMSADIEAAIAEGATIVRIGTALFGPR